MFTPTQVIRVSLKRRKWSAAERQIPQLCEEEGGGGMRKRSSRSSQTRAPQQQHTHTHTTAEIRKKGPPTLLGVGLWGSTRVVGEHGVGDEETIEPAQQGPPNITRGGVVREHAGCGEQGVGDEETIEPIQPKITGVAAVHIDWDYPSQFKNITGGARTHSHTPRPKSSAPIRLCPIHAKRREKKLLRVQTRRPRSESLSESSGQGPFGWARARGGDVGGIPAAAANPSRSRSDSTSASK